MVYILKLQGQIPMLDFTSWFWHDGLMYFFIVLVLVHHSCSTLPLQQCYNTA